MGDLTVIQYNRENDYNGIDLLMKGFQQQAGASF